MLAPARSTSLPAGIGALALAGAAGGALWLWWRRRNAAQSHELGDVGSWLPSWVTGGRTQDSHSDTFLAARAQVGRADERVPLTDIRQAENRPTFTTGARTSAGPAYFHTAYWLAVASRLLGYDAELVGLAKRNLAKGYAWSGVAGASLRTGNVSDIYREAATAIARRAMGNRQAQAAAVQVGFNPQDVESAQARDRDTNPLYMAPALVRANVSTAASGTLSFLEIATGLFTGRTPTGMSPWTWWALKWGTRVGVGALVLLGLRLYFAPEYEAAKGALAPLGRAAGSAGRRAAAAVDAWGRSGEQDEARA